MFVWPQTIHFPVANWQSTSFHSGSNPMNSGHSSIFFLLFAAAVFSVCPVEAAGQKADVVYTSPSGSLRIETAGEESGDTWAVSSNNPGQRAKLPRVSDSLSADDEFHSSPNDEWIFGLRHGGSGLRDGSLYHRSSPSKFEVPDSKNPFNEAAWKNVVKLGALKRNYSGEGFYAMTFFGSWSLDSGRLLVRLSGGEEKRAMQDGWLYFNTRTKAFEMTDYLRKLNKAHSGALACAEPVDPLPAEAELKARLESLDQKLNKAYAERVAKTDKQRVSILRESERTWIKNRDEGEKLYLSLTPPAEKERRRLQFLGDVTAARLDDFNRPADEDL